MKHNTQIDLPLVKLKAKNIVPLPLTVQYTLAEVPASAHQPVTTHIMYI